VSVYKLANPGVCRYDILPVLLYGTVTVQCRS